LFDIYRGEQIGKDEKSLAFSIVYRDHKTTLTDEVVDDIHGKVIKELERKLGARLRK
jgi:phenylalanyl-tRNA synthetase beta chain